MGVWSGRTLPEPSVVSVQEGVAHKRISVVDKASVRKVCSFGAMLSSCVQALKQQVRVTGFLRSRSLHAEIDLKREQGPMGVVADNALR